MSSIEILPVNYQSLTLKFSFKLTYMLLGWDRGQIIFIFQAGMFWLSGLTRDQGEKLAALHVYMMPSNGRMNLCGLNNNNLTYFADTLAQIVR